MAYVIAEPCVGVKDGACAEICPIDCIHTSAESEQYFINPGECIDCGLCETVCPVSAIYADDSLPVEWKHYIALNEQFFSESK